MKSVKAVIFPVLILVSCFSALSCVTMNTDITVRSNGSLRVSMEYRISRYIADMGSSEGEDSFIALGANCFICKPIDGKLFKETVCQLAVLSPPPPDSDGAKEEQPPAEKKEEKKE